MCVCVCVCVCLWCVTSLMSSCAQREPILELESYRELGRILIEDNNALKCLEIMANVFRHHHAELACTLVHLLGAYGKLIPIVLEATEQVIKKEGGYTTTLSMVGVVGGPSGGWWVD